VTSLILKQQWHEIHRAVDGTLATELLQVGGSAARLPQLRLVALRARIAGGGPCGRGGLGLGAAALHHQQVVARLVAQTRVILMLSMLRQISLLMQLERHIKRQVVASHVMLFVECIRSTGGTVARLTRPRPARLAQSRRTGAVRSRCRCTCRRTPAATPHSSCAAAGCSISSRRSRRMTGRTRSDRPRPSHRPAPAKKHERELERLDANDVKDATTLWK